MSSYALRAFIFKWTGNSAVLEFEGGAQASMERFVYHSVNHEINKKIAEKFGQVVTLVKVFPTENQGWIIVDKHTRRLLHRDIANKNDADDLCRKHGYQT
jgi:3-methyladenine DNA glycosylase AlkC